MEAWDIVVIGEVLGEFAGPNPFAQGVDARFGVSGDALNVAAAAAAAGARVALAAVLPDDDLGSAVVDRVRELGISDALLRRRPGSLGLYLVYSDPVGAREFFYARSGSAGSTLSPSDLDPAAIRGAGAVVASGIAGALSPSARAALLSAAVDARRFVYDPNFRPGLTSGRAAAALLAEIASRSFLITPSSPNETDALVGTTDPLDAARRVRAMGAQNVAVTCGSLGVQLVGESETWIEAVPAPRVVDQAGAGDAFLGTMVARIVLGESIEDAARSGSAAASLAVGVAGAASSIATWDEVRAHLRDAASQSGAGR
jgi:2-dehydro-3-deoxygluconokinase